MKNLKNKVLSCLGFSVLLHLITCICSVYMDFIRGPNGYKEINYGCNYFSYGSVQASLVTIVYFIYTLFKKSPSNYFDKVFDLIVINANIISISIFTVSVIGGGTLAPQRGGPINILSFAIDRKIYWGTYSIVWHYLAPILTIAYFTRRKISLAHTYLGRRRLFGYSFLHPLFYAAFVLSRPHIPGSEKYPFGSRERKSLYPYFFFGWIKHGKHNTLLGVSIITTIICLGLFLFGTSTLLFGGYANHKLKLKSDSVEKIKKNSSTY